MSPRAPERDAETSAPMPLTSHLSPLASCLSVRSTVPAMIFCFCARERMHEEPGATKVTSRSDSWKAPSRIPWGNQPSSTTSTATTPPPQPMRGWSAGPPASPVVIQPQTRPTALPVAQPVAQPGIQMAAYPEGLPVAQPYPTVAVARPMAYPAPSSPPSPPAEQRSKDE